ncbi:MAG TPA: hypothetical protein VEA36_01095 [Candidatus Paceibacterota bacterium]|nr:hypothetical protein [Candidatus Paceibacterota bacterium]
MSGERDYRPYYRIERPSFGSNGFEEHLALTYEVYRKHGYLEGESCPADLIDPSDGLDADYRLLYSPEDSLDGTFRILPWSAAGFPFERVCPDVAIPGGAARFCETTRLAGRSASGPRSPTAYIAFEAVIESMVYVRARGLAGLLSLASPALSGYINSAFESVYHPLGRARWYRGGYVIPTVLWLREFEHVLRIRNPGLLAYYRERGGF